MSELETYLIAHATLLAVPGIPLVVLWIFSFFTARQARDPARHGFILMKIAFPLFAISCCFYVASDCLIIYQLHYWAPALSFGVTTSRMTVLARFFERFAHTVLIICLAELGVGFLTRLTLFPGSNREQSGKWFRAAVRGVAAVLALVILGVAAGYLANFESNVRSTNLQRNNMFAGMQILSLVAATGLIMLGAVVMHRLKGGAHRNVSLPGARVQIRSPD